MQNQVSELKPEDVSKIIAEVILHGDLSKLPPAAKVEYYTQVCSTLGLNPATKPFEYIILNGKERLYAAKGCTDQLRRLYNISIKVISRKVEDGLCVVEARASTPDGREDEDVGAVSIVNLKGEQLANAIMKAQTKAKRRVTLSFCGLGMLDESEIEGIAPENKAPKSKDAKEVKDIEGSVIIDIEVQKYQEQLQIGAESGLEKLQEAWKKTPTDIKPKLEAVKEELKNGIIKKGKGG